MQYFLPSEKETEINLNFKDGQEPITIDALDVDSIILSIGEVPEDTTFESEFARYFFQKYGRRLSKVAVRWLCQIKAEVFAEIKKNLYQQPEPLNITTQEHL
jgi:hypothetical protein